ncbi:MAG: FHA domain-containing protein [Planctomycetota bacterium]|nr:MAG: FHA domain-containing protein [Planctomycetota bacterium]
MPAPTLVVVLESGVSRRVTLTERVVIGRDPSNQVAVDDGHLSRRHCELRWSGDRVSVRDLGSLNGTFVNGQRIHEECFVLPGDVLKMGRTRVYVDFGDADAQRVLPKIYAPDLTLRRGVQPLGTEKAPALAGPYERLRARLQTPDDPDASRSASAGPATRLQNRRIRPDDKTPVPLPRMEESAISRSSSSSRGSSQGQGKGLKAIAQISRVLANIGDPHEFLDYTLSRVLSVVPAERGIVMRLSAERRGLYPECARSALPSRSDAEALRLGISHTIARKVIRERVSVLVSDAVLDKRFQQASSIQDLQIRSVLCAPLWLGERISGLIYLDHLMHAYAFSEADRDFLVAAANLAALGLERVIER